MYANLITKQNNYFCNSELNSKNGKYYIWFQSSSLVRGLLQKGRTSHEILETPAHSGRENVRVKITGTSGKANSER